MILIYPNIKKEFKQDWCKNIKTDTHFRFDFCIEELKIIIELDGIHHFEIVKHWKNNPEEQLERDKFKMKCANDNGYSIIRILQEDIWFDRSNWKQDITNNILLITSQNKITNLYIDYNDEYNLYR